MSMNGRFVFPMIVIGGFCGTLDAQPLQCKSPVMDFGEIREGEKISLAFTVRNITRQTVTVDRVVASCGCMTSIKGPLTISPGADANIPIEFHSKGYGGLQIQKRVAVLVAEEGKKIPPLVLTLTGRIVGIPPQERIGIAPPEKHMFNERGIWHSLFIRGPLDKDIRISIKGPDWLKVRISEPRRREKLRVCEWEVQCAIGEVLTSRVTDKLVVTTNLPGFETSSIPVTVETKPVVTVSPPVLFMRETEPERTGAEELRITLLEECLLEGTDVDTPIASGDGPPTGPGSIPGKPDEPSIAVVPSDEGISVTPMTASSQTNEARFLISTCGRTPARMNLMIMVYGVCVKRVLVITVRPSRNGQRP